MENLDEIWMDLDGFGWIWIDFVVKTWMYKRKD